MTLGTGADAGQLVELNASAVVKSATVEVMHPAFEDNAFESITLGSGTGAMTVLASSDDEDAKVVEDGKATFSISEGSFMPRPAPGMQAPMGMPISIKFDGRNRIDGWSPSRSPGLHHECRRIG